jgi:hypothetical protein
VCRRCTTVQISLTLELSPTMLALGETAPPPPPPPALLFCGISAAEKTHTVTSAITRLLRSRAISECQPHTLGHTLELRRVPRCHAYTSVSTCKKFSQKVSKITFLSIFEWKKVLNFYSEDRPVLGTCKQPVQPHQPTVCASI